MKTEQMMSDEIEGLRRRVDELEQWKALRVEANVAWLEWLEQVKVQLHGLRETQRTMADGIGMMMDDLGWGQPDAKPKLRVIDNKRDDAKTEADDDGG